MGIRFELEIELRSGSALRWPYYVNTCLQGHVTIGGCSHGREDIIVKTYELILVSGNSVSSDWSWSYAAMYMCIWLCGESPNSQS